MIQLGTEHVIRHLIVYGLNMLHNDGLNIEAALHTFKTFEEKHPGEWLEIESKFFELLNKGKAENLHNGEPLYGELGFSEDTLRYIHKVSLFVAEEAVK